MGLRVRAARQDRSPGLSHFFSRAALSSVWGLWNVCPHLGVVSATSRVPRSSRLALAGSLLGMREAPQTTDATPCAGKEAPHVSTVWSWAERRKRGGPRLAPRRSVTGLRSAAGKRPGGHWWTRLLSKEYCVVTGAVSATAHPSLKCSHQAGSTHESNRR